MWLTSYGVSERGSLLATGSRRLVPRWSSLTTRNRTHSDLVGSFGSDFPGLSSCNACPTATTACNSDCPAHGAKPTITGIPESTYRSITAVGAMDVGQVICPSLRHMTHGTIAALSQLPARRAPYARLSVRQTRQEGPMKACDLSALTPLL